MSQPKTVTEKRWALMRGKTLVVGPKSYQKVTAEMDARLQRAKVVRVTLTYEVPK